MIKFLIGKIFGTRNERYLRSLRPRVRKINALEPSMQELTDEQLPEKLAEIREAVQSGERTLDDVLCEVFALVREASARVMGMRHYDVQLIGGMVLHAGKISEMKTGEGKTLVATLAVVPLSTEFSRQEYWSWLPFPSPGDLPDPGIESGSPCIAGRFFTI